MASQRGLTKQQEEAKKWFDRSGLDGYPIELFDIKY